MEEEISILKNACDSSCVVDCLDRVFQNMDGLNEYSWDIFQILLEMNGNVCTDDVRDDFLLRLVAFCNPREMFLWISQYLDYSRNYKNVGILTIMLSNVVNRITRKQDVFIADAFKLISTLFIKIWNVSRAKKDEIEGDGTVIDPSVQNKKMEIELIERLENLISNCSLSIFISFGFSFVNNESIFVTDDLVIGYYLNFLEYLSLLSLNKEEYSLDIAFLIHFFSKSSYQTKLLFGSICNGDLSESNFDSIIIESSKGIAWLWYNILIKGYYISFLNSMIHPIIIFNGLAVHIRSVLLTELPIVILPMIELIEKIIDSISFGSIHISRDLINENHLYILLIQEILNAMTWHPDREIRRKLYECLLNILNRFSEATQFYILSILIEKCPFESIKGELIHQLKECIRKLWNNIESPSSILIFKGTALHQQLSYLQNNPSSLGNSSDSILNYLNLIRFLFLMDKKEDRLNLKYIKMNIVSNYLSIQIQHAKEELEKQYHTMDSSEQSKVSTKQMNQISSMQGLPPISQEQFSSGTIRYITNLQLILDLSERVLDIIKEN